MEFQSHLKSPRLIALAGIMALVVLGSAWGYSRIAATPFGNSIQIYGHPALSNESSVVHSLVVAFLADSNGTPQSGLSVTLYKNSFNASSNGSRELIGTLTTNASGFVSFDLGTSGSLGVLYELESPGVVASGGLYFDPELANLTFTYSQTQISFPGSSGTQSYCTVHVLEVNGIPAQNAVILLNGTLLGHTGPNGLYRFQMPVGNHIVNITYGGGDQSFTFNLSPQSQSTYQNSADGVLLVVATAFAPLVLPLVAIAVSFDAITRERMQGSLELLMCRRVSREGILLGKFLGAFASVSLPIIMVLIAGIEIVSVVSGRPPTPSFSVVVLLSSMFLVGVWVLIMLVFAPLAKSVATGVLYGVILWAVFDLLFAFIAFIAISATGLSPAEPDYFNLYGTILLFDPNTVFQMLVAAAVPTTGTSPNGSGSLLPAYVSFPTLVAAAILWLALMYMIATFIFARKAEL